MRRRDGGIFAGAFHDERQQGSGVYRFSDGRREEGQWIDGAPSGLMAMGDANGALVAQAVYGNGQMTTSLTR